MARAKNQWKTFSFKKLQLLSKQLETKVGKEKVVASLAKTLNQSSTATRGYLARRMVPNAAAQEKLNQLFLQNNPVKSPNVKVSIRPTKKVETPAGPAVAAPKEPSKDILIPISMLRKLVLKMPVTERELNVLETLLTR